MTELTSISDSSLAVLTRSADSGSTADVATGTGLLVQQYRRVERTEGAVEFVALASGKTILVESSLDPEALEQRLYDERNEILSHRERTPEQTRRLGYIDWQLDRIEKKQLSECGRELSDLVKAKEDFASYVRNMTERIEQSIMSKPRR